MIKTSLGRPYMPSPETPGLDPPLLQLVAKNHELIIQECTNAMHMHGCRTCTWLEIWATTASHMNACWCTGACFFDRSSTWNRF